jgi:hypothetical protein
MSSLLELKRRMPRASLSNEGPLSSWKSGRLVGRCLQYMMPLYLAAHDDHSPSGSINGLGERGGITPGFIRLDPIATALERSMGLEEHEEAGFEPQHACASCGKLEACGACGCCSEEPPRKRSRRAANLNPAFARAVSHLACANIDVHVSWKQPQPEAEAPPPPCQDPDDVAWRAVPRKRLDVSMLDLKRRDASERGSEQSRTLRVAELASGGCEVLSFGPAPLDRICCQQLLLSMRALGQGVVWESGDHSRGFTLVAPRAAEGFYEEALLQAAEDYAALAASLASCSFAGRLAGLRLEQLEELAPGLWMAWLPGGTLHLQTTSARTKELLKDLLDYGNSVRRSHRAYLVEDVGLELLPLENPSYSCWRTCNELELREKLQRELSYLCLATTLAALPLRRDFFLEGPTVLEAFFLLDAEAAHLSASDVYVEREGRLLQLFHEDAVLGPNPRARGWLQEGRAERLPLRFIVHRSRVDRYETAWQELPHFAEALRRGDCDEAALDKALSASNRPTLVACDQRSVHRVRLRKGRQLPERSVCSRGVFDGLGDKAGRELAEALERRSWLLCTDCGDCTRGARGEDGGSSAAAALRDIEDLSGLSAHDYALRHCQEKGRQQQQPSGVRVEQQDRWAFQCHCDEDLHPQGLRLLEAATEPPKRLQGLPRVDVLLDALPPPSPAQLQAEERFLAAFCRSRGGSPEQLWRRKACGALQLLVEAARELSEAVRGRRVDYV